jgi:hypothetical protein
MVGDGTMLPGVVMTGAWWLVSLIVDVSYFLTARREEMMQWFF